MTKKELKQSFSKIQPSEALVNETIAQMRACKVREHRRISLPRYSQGLRLAGAVCTLALVFSLGFATAKVNPNIPQERTLADLHIVNTMTVRVPTPTLGTECANGYLLINGNISSLNFLELTEADIDNKIIHRCKVIINAEGLIKKSNELTVDLHQTSEKIEAEIVFRDESTMNAFFHQSTQEMLLCLVPGANNNWSIIDFSPFEK